MAESKVRANDIIGKPIVSEQTGKKFGIVANIDFVTESGELLNILVDQPTKSLLDLNPKTDDKGRPMIPFTAVKSVGDFVIISEGELI